MHDWVWNLLAQSGQPMQGAMLMDKLARVPISKIVLFAAALTVVRIALFQFLKKTPIHKREGSYNIAKFVNDVTDAIIYAAIVVFLLVRPFGIQTFFIPSESMTNTLRIGDFIVANKFIFRTSPPKAGDIVVFRPIPNSTDETVGNSDLIKRCIAVPGDIIEFDKFDLIKNGKVVNENYKILSGRDPSRGTHDLVLPQDEIESMVDGWFVNYPPFFKFISYEIDGKSQIVPMFFDNRPDREPTAMINVGLKGSEVTLSGEAAAIAIAKPAEAVPPKQYLMIGDNRNGSSDGRFWGFVPEENIVGKAEFTWLPLPRAKKLQNSETVYNSK